jgi:hypothetical protein
MTSSRVISTTSRRSKRTWFCWFASICGHFPLANAMPFDYFKKNWWRDVKPPCCQLSDLPKCSGYLKWLVLGSIDFSVRCLLCMYGINMTTHTGSIVSCPVEEFAKRERTGDVNLFLSCPIEELRYWGVRVDEFYLSLLLHNRMISELVNNTTPSFAIFVM